jgi:hypothetical protein
VSYKKQETLTLPEHLGSPPFFCLVVHFAHLFSFLCCVVFLCYMCLGPVSCMPNVACVSGLSILDRLDLPFSVTFIFKHKSIVINEVSAEALTTSWMIPSGSNTIIQLELSYSIVFSRRLAVTYHPHGEVCSIQ